MTHFKIAGTPDCPFFGHALHVAYFLSEKLPNFKVIQYEIEPTKWKSWVRQINVDNGWQHYDSPLIWKELTKCGGKPYYIGGLSEFWEYCYDYYGLESILLKHELQKIVDDSMQYFRSEQNKKQHAPKLKKIKIFVSGGSAKMIFLFLMELFQLDIINKQEILIVHLHNRIILEEELEINYFLDAIHELSFKPVLKVSCVDNLEDGLIECNLFIIFGDLTRQKDEGFKAWLDRNNEHVQNISNDINRLNTKLENDLRIIVAIHGPVCFYATILADSCPNINPCDIVAVTADIGLETLNVVSKETKIPIHSLGAPPVWGFAGINHIVDIDHIVQIYNVYRPYNRALKINADSTLISGKFCTELRFFNYKTYELTDIWRKIKNTKETFKENFQRNTLLPKIRATISLLNNWYSETETGNIISLGLVSDGYITNFPENLCYSMPVILKNGKWRPMTSYPEPEKNICKIEDFLPFVLEILSPYVHH